MYSTSVGPRRRAGSLVIILAMLVAMVAVNTEPAEAVSPGTHGSRVVSQNAPVSWTPHVLDGYVRTFAEVGNIVLAGGNFSQVSQYNSQAVLSRSNIVAFQKGNGVITSFDPQLNGEVFGILPTGDGQNVWVVGGFSSVNGQTVRNIVKLNVNTGQRVTAFNAPAFNGRIHEVMLRGERLYVAGRFTTAGSQTRTLLAALNPTTGALLPDVNLEFAGPLNDGHLTITAADATPDGSRMAVIGNFTQVNGETRSQLAVLDLTTNPVSVANWHTAQYGNVCSGSFQSYMRDIEVSPDGKYFVVVVTGAFRGGHPNSGNTVMGSPCDTAMRWEFDDSGSDLLPTWANYTGGDTLLSTAVTESITYLGGHQRRANNPFCSDCFGRGAVTREGLSAVFGVSGATASWNPGRDRGVGVYGMLATNEGLWIGSDTTRIGRWHFRPRIAFMPLSSGWDLPAEYTGALPGTVYSVGRDSGSSQEQNQLLRREFDGDSVSNSQEITSGIDWGNIRGAFMVDGVLYYGWEQGGSRSFRKATFNGQTLGSPQILELNQLVDPLTTGNPPANQLDANRGTGSSMGSGTARSPLNVTNFLNFDLANARGMFYDAEAGRLYFNTVATSGGGGTAVRLSWRQFTTESDVIGAVRENGPTSAQAGIDWNDVRSMFLASGHLYVATSNGNLTRYAWQSNAGTRMSGTPIGAGELVSGPGVDEQDWRARDAFLFVGEGEVPPNQAPVALFSFDCDGATCEFDGSASEDPDGTIASYSWDFDDDTAPGSGEVVSHTFQASDTYNVALTVTDDADGTDTVTIPVTVTVPNLPPSAEFTFSCTGLTCNFDASASMDPEGDSLEFSWNFGDDATDTGVTASHTYDDGGTFTVTLTVSDGTSSPQTSQDVSVVDPSQVVDVEFRGVDVSNVNSSAPRVTVPGSVQAGDVLVMIASTNSTSPTVTGPEGWTPLGGAGNSTASSQTWAWWKKATAADAGSSVGPNLSSYAKTALQVLAYSNADVVSDSAFAIDTDSGTVRTTPTVAVGKAGSMLVSYWADKSSGSSGWTLPAGVTERGQTVGSGGGLIAAAVADSGPLAVGDAGGLVATSGASANRRGHIWSIVIAPVD